MKVSKKQLYDIVAFGEILIDFTSEGQNSDGQVIFARNPGGAPGNVAVAASRLGAQTAFLGKAGKDMHGEFLKEVLQKENVETKGLILDEKYFTTLAFVRIDDDGERSFAFARKPGADTCIDKKELDQEVLDGAKIFHVGSLSLTDEPAKEATFYGVRRAKTGGAIISYDPNYRASLWESKEKARTEMRSLIPYVDVMKLSDEETELLTDCEEPKKAAEVLLSGGVKAVAITLGAKGAYICSKRGGAYVQGFESRVVDTTGAGDAFWGGFLYRLSKSGKEPEALTIEELTEFARYGNAVAGLCVERKGAIPAMPTPQEVKARWGCFTD